MTHSDRSFLWAYYEGAEADRDRVWIGNKGDMGFLASPTDDDLFMAAVVPSAHEGREAHADGLSRWPELHATIAGARRVGPVRVMSRTGRLLP